MRDIVATIQADQYRLITREPAPRRWLLNRNRELSGAATAAARAGVC